MKIMNSFLAAALCLLSASSSFAASEKLTCAGLQTGFSEMGHRGRSLPTEFTITLLSKDSLSIESKISKMTPVELKLVSKNKFESIQVGRTGRTYYNLELIPGSRSEYKMTLSMEEVMGFDSEGGSTFEGICR